MNARFTGPHTEPPLHWAVSSNDVEVLDALLDAGADIGADGAVIAGGTPPWTTRFAFGQGQAARRLVQRGTRTSLFNPSALGLLDRVQQHLATKPPSTTEVTSALWASCHGGQQATAVYLLELGADLNWLPRGRAHPLGRRPPQRGPRGRRPARRSRKAAAELNSTKD